MSDPRDDYLVNFLLFTAPGTILIGILTIVNDWGTLLPLSALILWLIFVSVPGTYFGFSFFIDLFKEMFQTAMDYAAFVISFIIAIIVFYAVAEYALMPAIDADQSIFDKPLAAIFIIIVPAFAIAVLVGRWFNLQRTGKR